MTDRHVPLLSRTRGSRRGRPVRALILALVALALALALLPLPAAAHALPVRSEPAANAILPAGPKQVQIWFDEALTPSGSTITVFNAHRQEFDLGHSRVDPKDSKHLTVSVKSPLPNGQYTVAWTSISADDGHVVHGSFTFSVGLSTLPGAGGGSSTQGIPSPAAVIVRWLAFLGLMIPAGWFLVGLLGLPLGTTRRWLPAAGAAVALVADLALVPVEAYLPGPGIPRQALANVPAELPPGWHWRLLAEALLLLLVVGLVNRRRAICPRRGILAVGAVLAAAGIFGLAATSHAAARTHLVALSLSVETVHLELVAFWLGAVVQLAALPACCRAEQRPLLSRFSRLALGLAPLAVLSGAGLALLTFPSLASLWTSGYGRILLVKAALVAGIFALAYRNHRAIATGLRRAASFARSLRAETVVALLAILAAATMGLWTPPRPKPIVTLELRGTAGTNLVAHLNITPITAGPNRLEAWLTNDQNQPVPGVTGVTADTMMLDRAVSQTGLLLQALPDGHWAYPQADFTVRGWWEIQLSFQGPKVAANAMFVVIVPDPLLVGPPPHRTSEPAAAQLFQAAMTTLGQLRSMREYQDLGDGVGNSVVTVLSYVAPDRFSYQTNAGGSSVAIGDSQWFRSDGGPWTEQQRIAPLDFPSTLLTYYSGSNEFTLGQQQVVDGETCQILTFYAPANSGRGQAWYAFWVGTKTHLIRREAMIATSHYMLVHYYDFNAPITITAPAPAPTPTPTPAATP